jgi:hypothetical protein
MIDRFRVATRAAEYRPEAQAAGIRRNVYVHIYDDREELAHAHAAALGKDPATLGDMAGGQATQTTHGFPWPKPDPGPVLVIRLWNQQLTTRTIAHEATHAAAAIFFMDHLPGWEARARGIYLGDNEALCYAVGDITSEIVRMLYKRGHLEA